MAVQTRKLIRRHLAVSILGTTSNPVILSSERDLEEVRYNSLHPMQFDIILRPARTSKSILLIFLTAGLNRYHLPSS